MYLNKVEICGVNTAKLPTLKESETRELLKKAQDGDRAARDKLIQGNLRLVLSVVQKFANRGENMDDLFQVGCIGLIKSIDNFDLSQNVRFSTYAVPMAVACRKARGDERAGERGGEERRFSPASGPSESRGKNLRKIEKTY